MQAVIARLTDDAARGVDGAALALAALLVAEALGRIADAVSSAAAQEAQPSD